MPSKLLVAIRKSVTALAVISVLTLSACDSAEERAEKHFQSGMELLQAGDVDRALVEFRNVFKLNGEHKEARRAYAQAERKRGRLREAFAQYLRLVEQYPEDLDAQRALAEIAAQSGDLDETERHVTAALGIDPNDPGAQAVKIVLDYGRAKQKGDIAAMGDATTRATAFMEKLPGSQLLAGIIIDDALARQDYDRALATLDEAIAQTPDDASLYGLRLSTLAAKGDNAGVEAGLVEMVAKFPEDQTISDTLVRWYISQDALDKAEAYLRSRLTAQDDDPIKVLSLVRFLAEMRGPEAAVAELDRQIASGKATPMYRSTRAGLLFDQGQRDAAIAEMEDVLKTAEPSDETQKIKVGLARMLSSNGNPVGARALVEEVLTEDPGDIDAMKLKANWLIMNDEVADAISLLRRALDDHPRDADVMTLMAQAHERDGNRELMRDMLALAVEASGKAPAETLRYAQAMAAEGEYVTAEGALIEALRLAPGLPELLVPLGQIYISIKDWPRAETVIKELESLKDPNLTDVIAELNASVFAGQQSTDQAVGYLQGIVDEGAAGLSVQIALIRAHLANGDNAAARAYAEKLLEADPENPSLRFILATVQAVDDDFAPAEKTFRDLVAEDPARTQVWMALYRIVAADPARLADAGKVLDDALAANPDTGELKWAKAGFLENSGDVDGAIKVYEELYAENSSNMIVANNLASLITSYRTDEESLARAEVIARRLRGTDIPAYQDTYGWIAYRRGLFADAETELTKASQGLPEDPMVQYHLAMTYLALGKKPEAAAQFAKVLSLVPSDDARDFVETSRAEAAKLESEGVNANN